MRRALRQSLLVLGLACLIASGVLYWENQSAEALAETTSSSISQQIQLSLYEQTKSPEPSPAAATVEIDGEQYVGILFFSQLGLELPISSTYSDAKLRETPCVYAGDITEDTLIIAAHNYTAHFGTIHQLVPGATVTLLDAAGMVHTYTVTEQVQIDGNDVDGLYGGDWDLTLFTCLYGDNTQRVVVRLLRAEP